MPNEEAEKSEAEENVSSGSGEEAKGARDGDGAPEQAAPADPLEAAQTEISQLKEKLLRTAADFDNFRKRSRREIADAEKKGRDTLLKDLLPVFDNLERAGTHVQGGDDKSEANFKGLAEGIDLVIRQFRDTLSKLGIERIESVGEPFDPAVHEAIQHLETSEHSPGSIAAEVQPGYREGDRLLRPALVVVAKAPSDQTSRAEGSDGAPEEG